MECKFIYSFFERNILINNSLRFLLARLHLDSLEDKISVMEVEDALEKLPKGEYAYRQAYDEAMEKRIKGQKPIFSDLALRTLSWITFSKRPLTTSELQHALAVTDGASTLDLRNLTHIDLITSVCAGLVTVDEESDIIRLVHYTTQEYFDQTWATWFPDGQTDIAKTCVTYLSFKAFETGISHTYEDFKARLQSNILYDYAARNWGHHARVSSIEGGKLILDFLESPAKASASSQAMMYSEYGYSTLGETQMIGIHLAAYFGLQESMSALLDKKADIEFEHYFYGQTPLSRAAGNGHEAPLSWFGVLVWGGGSRTKPINGTGVWTRLGPWVCGPWSSCVCCLLFARLLPLPRLLSLSCLLLARLRLPYSTVASASAAPPTSPALSASSASSALPASPDLPAAPALPVRQLRPRPNPATTAESHGRRKEG